MDNKLPCTYIMASQRNGTLYVGVTSDLMTRIAQHREGTFAGFTQRYAVKRLVWFETGGDMEAAIAREKQIKNWHRPWKLNMIEAVNPDWRDLAVDLGFAPLSGP